MRWSWCRGGQACVVERQTERDWRNTSNICTQTFVAVVPAVPAVPNESTSYFILMHPVYTRTNYTYYLHPIIYVRSISRQQRHSYHIYNIHVYIYYMCTCIQACARSFFFATAAVFTNTACMYSSTSSPVMLSAPVSLCPEYLLYDTAVQVILLLLLLPHLGGDANILNYDGGIVHLDQTKGYIMNCALQ